MKYSFLMSVYYKEKPDYLKTSIDSMLNQTQKPDEIIIVEDGKLTEELEEVIEKYKKENPNIFTVVKLEKNIGLGLALNKGIEISRNELIARMDSDDISRPNRCEKQLKRFEEKPGLSIVGSYIDEFKDTIENIISMRKVPRTTEEIYEFAKRRSAFNHPTVMYKKSEILKQNGYANLRRNQDVDLFGRMMFAGCKAENIDEALVLFRTNDDLAKRRKSWENTKSYINTIKKFWKIGYSSFNDYIVVAIAQIGMYIMPVKLQYLIYKIFLRR